MADVGASVDRPGRGTWLLCVVFAVGSCGLVPALLVRWQDDVATPLNIALGMTLLVYSGLRLTELIYRGSRDLLNVFFFIFVYVFLAVPSLAEFVTNQYPIDNRVYSDALVTAGLLHIMLAVAAYEVGRVLARQIISRWRVRRSHRRDAEVSRPLVIDASKPRAFSPSRTFALAIFGLLMVLYEVGKHGIRVFFSSRYQVTNTLANVAPGSGLFYNSTNKTTGLLLTIGAQEPVFVALFAILYCRRHGLWPKGRPASDLAWRVLIVLLIAANVVVNNPIAAARVWFSVVAIAFVSVYLPFQRPRTVRLLAVGSVVILMFAFTTLDAFRSPGGAHDVAKGPRQDLLINQTYGEFQEELNGELYVQAHGHTMGRQIAGAVLVFLPRHFWRNKPGPTGQLIDPHYVRSSTALTEAEVDFGSVGIVVLFLLYAFVVAALGARAARAGPGLLACIYPALGAYQIFLMRGSLQPAFGVLYGLLGVIAIAWLPPRRGLASHRPTPSPDTFDIGDAPVPVRS